MVARTIVVRLRAEFDQARRKVAEFGSTVKDNAASVDDLSNQVGILGTALVGFAALAVTRFAQFDKQMSAVQAATRATGSELDSLRQAAIKAGADTAFSATEAAAGIEELAKAGVSTADILGGGLTGALDLAAAGNLEVADAAQIAAVAIQQFNLQGRDVPHIADLLAAGAGKAVGSVSDLSQALNQSGLIASQTGLSIEETTAGLAAFASAGLLGSDAGTSFKTMLQVLAAPSSTARKQMDELGISAYDASGNFVGLEALAGNLRSALADLTPEQRSAALATIFGSDAVRAASVIYNEGAAGIRNWTTAVDDQGFAAEQARLQTDNLIGDLERLGGSFDAVLIQSGSGANSSLRAVVQTAEALVDAVGEIPGPVLTTITLIAGSAGLAALGVAGLGKLTVSFAEARAAATALGISTRGAALAAGALGGALAIGTVAFAAWAQAAADAEARTDAYMATLDELGGRTDATVLRINESLAENQNSWLRDIFQDTESLIDRAEKAGIAVEDLQGYILGEADAIERVNAATEAYVRAGAGADGMTPGEVRAQASRFLTGALDDEAEALTDAEKAQAQKARADAAAGVASEEMAGATSSATSAIQEQTDAVEENFQALLDASGQALSLRDAQRQMEGAYDDAAKAVADNGKTLDVTTEKGRANQSALDNIAKAGLEVVESMRANGASQKDLRGVMETTRERFIQTARSMGATRGEARDLADALGLIPRNIKTDVQVATSQALAHLGILDRTLNSIDGKTVTAAVAIKQYGQAGVATGGRLAGFPTGGRLPGSSPADPMADNLLGVDALGMPRVLVRSREWVINEPASDYYGDGIMAAINSRAIPREAIAGLTGLANGGAVAGAQRRLDVAEREVQRARAQVRRANAAAREAAAAERRAARTNSEADDRAAARYARTAERSQREAEKRLDAAERGVDAARDKRARLVQDTRETSTAVRRGEVSDSVTSSLDSALGVVDQLRDQSRNTDLGPRTRSALSKRATEAERALTKLYASAEKVETKLADARDRMGELQQISDAVATRLNGEQNLGDAFTTTTNPWSGEQSRTITAQGILAGAQGTLSRVRSFATKLKALAKAGLAGRILSEIANMGTEDGIAAADALLADPTVIAQLNQAYKSLDYAANQAGQGVTEGYAKGGLDAAEAFVKGLEKQQAAIEKQIGGWGTSLGKSLLAALGLKQLKNGSIVPRALGGPMNAGQTYLVGELGPELVTPRSPGFVHTAAETRYSMSQPSKTLNLNVTTYYAQAEPTSVTTNRALAAAAAVGI